jgi:hypothetical protein
MDAMKAAHNTPVRAAVVAHCRTLLAGGLAAALLAGCVVAPPLPPPPGRASQGQELPPPPPPPPSAGGPESMRAPIHSPIREPARDNSGPMYFYPERAQTESQQDRDRYECYRWAVRETGFDPGMTAVRQPMVEVQPIQPLRDGSGVVAGAATGAILGAAVSSPRQAGANAVIGAIFGAVLGASAQESRAQAIEQVQARRQQQAAAANAAARAPLDNFRRAMSACMSGRGYRVG